MVYYTNSLISDWLVFNITVVAVIELFHQKKRQYHFARSLGVKDGGFVCFTDRKYFIQPSADKKSEQRIANDEVNLSRTRCEVLIITDKNK